mgnify:CR=1 FL=1
MSLPEPILDQWRAEALRRDMSLGEIILEKAGMGKAKNMNIQEKIRADFAAFDKISKLSGKYDAVKAIREDRDRNDY